METRDRNRDDYTSFPTRRDLLPQFVTMKQILLNGGKERGRFPFLSAKRGQFSINVNLMFN